MASLNTQIRKCTPESLALFLQEKRAKHGFDASDRMSEVAAETFVAMLKTAISKLGTGHVSKDKFLQNCLFMTNSLESLIDQNNVLGAFPLLFNKQLTNALGEMLSCLFDLKLENQVALVIQNVLNTLLKFVHLPRGIEVSALLLFSKIVELLSRLSMDPGFPEVPRHFLQLIFDCLLSFLPHWQSNNLPSSYLEKIMSKIHRRSNKHLPVLLKYLSKMDDPVFQATIVMITGFIGSYALWKEVETYFIELIGVKVTVDELAEGFAEIFQYPSLATAASILHKFNSAIRLTTIKSCPLSYVTLNGQPLVTPEFGTDNPAFWGEFSERTKRFSILVSPDGVNLEFVFITADVVTSVNCDEDRLSVLLSLNSLPNSTLVSNSAQGDPHRLEISCADHNHFSSLLESLQSFIPHAKIFGNLLYKFNFIHEYSNFRESRNLKGSKQQTNVVKNGSNLPETEDGRKHLPSDIPSKAKLIALANEEDIADMISKKRPIIQCIDVPVEVANHSGMEKNLTLASESDDEIERLSKAVEKQTLSKERKRGPQQLLAKEPIETLELDAIPAKTRRREPKKTYGRKSAAANQENSVVFGKTEDGSNKKRSLRKSAAEAGLRVRQQLNDMNATGISPLSPEKTISFSDELAPAAVKKIRKGVIVESPRTTILTQGETVSNDAVNNERAVMGNAMDAVAPKISKNSELLIKTRSLSCIQSPIILSQTARKSMNSSTGASSQSMFSFFMSVLKDSARLTQKLTERGVNFQAKMEEAQSAMQICTQHFAQVRESSQSFNAYIGELNAFNDKLTMLVQLAENPNISTALNREIEHKVLQIRDGVAARSGPQRFDYANHEIDNLVRIVGNAET